MTGERVALIAFRGCCMAKVAPPTSLQIGGAMNVGATAMAKRKTPSELRVTYWHSVELHLVK